MKQLRKLFKIVHRRLKRPTKIASKRAHRVVRFSLKQLRIRPRIHFSFGTIVALFAILALSSYMVSYLKPKEAQIKVNGQPVLVAFREPEAPKEEVELTQEIVSRRSPFDFRAPVDGGYISQSYSGYHRANDIAAPFNSSLHPVGSGIVEFAGQLTDGRGNVVIIAHGDGLKSLYAHMNSIEVGVGNMVNSSTKIGTIGMTGRTTGPHVHLEIYDGDMIIDPAAVLPN